MPLNLLQDIAEKPLPWTAETPEDIERVRALRASGHAAAFVSAPGSARPYARVLAITPMGRQALRAQAPAEALA